MIKDNDKSMIIINNKEIQFDYCIEECIAEMDKFFILLNIPMNVELTEKEVSNIICYNVDGTYKWTIKNCYDPNYPKMTRMPFVLIHLWENGELRCTDFSGRNYLINIDDGTLSDLKTFK